MTKAILFKRAKPWSTTSLNWNYPRYLSWTWCSTWNHSRHVLNNNKKRYSRCRHVLACILRVFEDVHTAAWNSPKAHASEIVSALAPTLPWRGIAQIHRYVHQGTKNLQNQEHKRQNILPNACIGVVAPQQFESNLLYFLNWSTTTGTGTELMSAKLNPASHKHTQIILSF